MEKKLKEKVELITNWLIEKKADDIVAIDVKDKCNFTEFIIVCTGMAYLHNKAIADFIMEKAHEYKIKVLGKEGFQAATWILIDFNDIVVHIFTSEIRNNYKLEDLWTNEIKKND